MKNQENCPLCKHSESESLHELIIENEFLKEEKELLTTNNYRRNYILFRHLVDGNIDNYKVVFKLCKKCGFIYFTPRPEEADLAKKYELIQKYADTIAREKARELVDLREFRSQKIFDRLNPYLIKKTGKVLDVGGADGHCLASFTKNYECGILDYEDRKMWPNVKKLGQTFKDLASEDLFDAILTCHTLEHIEDINGYIKTISDRLVEGGIIYIEVPLGCDGEIYETKNIITHINFFSDASLGCLLKSNSLKLLKVKSGPLISKKRYLPVITAIAQKNLLRKKTLATWSHLNATVAMS